MKLGQQLKASFVTGLVLVTPLVVTIFVLNFLTGFLLRFVNPIVTGTRLTRYTANIELLAQLIALGAVVLSLLALGFAARWGSTQRLLGRFGRTVAIIPLVGTIYSSVRQVSNALADQSSRYDRAVLVEYPREGMFTIGLVTGEVASSVEGVTGQDAYYVFIPNSPNPTAGRLVLLPAHSIHEVDMSVGEGIRTIVTTGMGGPEAELERVESTVQPE